MTDSSPSITVLLYFLTLFLPVSSVEDTDINSTTTPTNRSYSTESKNISGFRVCKSDKDCNVKGWEFCNTQYTDLLVPPCNYGFCQCQPGFVYTTATPSGGTCRNECKTASFGDVCGDYPTKLLPKDAKCKQNSVECKLLESQTGKYCPGKENVRTRNVTFGGECNQLSDCEHYSLACLPHYDKTTKRSTFTCQCPSRDYLYDRISGHCRRYSLGDECSDYCGNNSTLYKTGLTCNNGFCQCLNETWAAITVTLPAPRMGVPDFEAFLEVFESVLLCAHTSAKIHLQPGTPCDMVNMLAICDEGSFCLRCINECPNPICRGLRKSSNFDKLIFTNATDNPICQPAIGRMISQASKIEVRIILLALFYFLPVD